MLEDVLRYCNRLRPNDDFVKCVCPGTYTIKDGSIAPPILVPGLNYAIWGSDFNDGVHGPDDELTDETFAGAVWILKPEKAFLDLVDEIKAWRTAYEAAALSIYQSESWGGWSGSKRSTTDGSPITWKSTFAAQLAAWRKI